MKIATWVTVGLLTIGLSTPLYIHGAEGAEKSYVVKSDPKAQEAPAAKRLQPATPGMETEKRQPIAAAVSSAVQPTPVQKTIREGKPDLMVQDIWVNEASQINIRLKNAGPGMVPMKEYDAARLVLKVKSGAKVLGFHTITLSSAGGTKLRPGGGWSVYNTRIACQEKSVVAVTVDAEDVISESNETNNTLKKTVEARKSSAGMALKKQVPSKGFKASASAMRTSSAMSQVAGGGSSRQVPRFLDMGLRVLSPAAGHVTHRGGNLGVQFKATREIPAGNVEIRVMSGTNLVASTNVAYVPPASPPLRPELQPIWTTEVYIGGDAPYAENYIVVAQHSDAYGISDTFSVRPIREMDGSVIRRDLELLNLENAYGTSLRARVRNNGEGNFSGDVLFRVTSVMLSEIMNVIIPLNLTAGRISDGLDLIPLELMPSLECGAIYIVEMDPEDRYVEFDEGNNRLEMRIYLMPRKVKMSNLVTVYNASSGSTSQVGYSGTIRWSDLGVSERDPDGTQNIRIITDVQNCGYEHWNTSEVRTTHTGYWPCTDESIGDCEQTGTFSMGMYRFDLSGGETKSCDFRAGGIHKTNVEVILDLGLGNGPALGDDFRFNIHF